MLGSPRSSARLAFIAAAAIGLTGVLACADLVTPESELTLDAHRWGWRSSDLDLDLRRTLFLASEGKGLAYFQLPMGYQLGRIPQDPKNPLTRQKVLLGQLLFHETALAVNNVRPEGLETYACTSCHPAQGGFMANLPQGMAEGGSGFGLAGEGRTLLAQYNSSPDKPDVQPIRTPTIMNGAYQALVLWNGQFAGVEGNLGTEDRWTPGTPVESNHLGLHGLETQAHAGLKMHRMESVGSSRVASIPDYQFLFRAVFPKDKNPINRLNAALAIGAFERTVLANQSPWQRWLRGDTRALTDGEKRGALLFFGKAGCVDCHTGPALNSMSFYALGMDDLDGAYDPSRVDLRPTDGTVPDGTRLGRGGFTGREDDYYKFKTPQLYNLVSSPFYGHGASFGSVRAVVEYINAGVSQNPRVPAKQLAPEFVPLGLKTRDIDDLVAFLERALYDPNLLRYVPKKLPSGNCTPVNDPEARLDLGCDEGAPTF